MKTAIAKRPLNSDLVPQTTGKAVSFATHPSAVQLNALTSALNASQPIQRLARLQSAANDQLVSAPNTPIQRMLSVSDIAKLLMKTKVAQDFTDAQNDNVLYWNTQSKFDGLKGAQLDTELLKYANISYVGKTDKGGRAAGQPNKRSSLPTFMENFNPFSVALPNGIGTLQFAHGHNFVLGTDNNKWISNNITWTGEVNKKKFAYQIHCIVQFQGPFQGQWTIDPHITIRNVDAQLRQTALSMISDPKDLKREKKALGNMDATYSSYSIGIGDTGRKPGTSMGEIPTEFTEAIFKPWLTNLRDVTIPAAKK